MEVTTREPTQLESRGACERGFPELANPTRVIVVGAGLAGLATAYELVKHGYEVTVLEARNRAGGRAYTLRAPFADGLYAEAGAMTVTDHCYYSMHYIRELEVELERSDLVDASLAYHLKSQRINPDGESIAQSSLPLHPHERHLGVMGLRDHYLGTLCEELAPEITADEWEVTERLAPYDRMSVRDLLLDRGASYAAIQLIEPLFLAMQGSHLESASALSWLRLEASPHALSHADSGWYKIKGGTDVFPSAFAKRLKDHIRYGKPVVRIEQQGGGVGATFLDHGRAQTLEADHLVMTVPFSAIRHIDFSAAGLSGAKHDAMRRLRYTSTVRTYLQMRRQFWSGHHISLCTDLPIDRVRDATPHMPGPRKILESIATGPRAHVMAAMTTEERVRFALDQIELILPGAHQHFEVGTSIAWSHERYNEGAYILPERGHADLMPLIRRPEGRVHFAGEHSAFEPNGGAMTFALESAARVLVEIGAQTT